MCLAVPGKIVSIDDSDDLLRHGKIDFSGVKRDISLAYVPEAKVGDYVLVHVGFALSVVDEEEAAKIFEELEALGEAGEAIPPEVAL